MASNADYANALDLRSAGPVDRGEVRWRLLDALQHAFELGQLLALPTLAEIVRVRDDHDAGLPISSDASWLQIGPAGPCSTEPASTSAWCSASVVTGRR